MPLWELARKVESDRVRLMWWASRHRAESRQIQSLAMLLSMLAKQPHRPARKVVSENTANENNHMQCRCECWRERSWVAAYAWCYEHQGTEQHPDKYNHMQCCCQCLKISLIALIILMDLNGLKALVPLIDFMELMSLILPADLQAHWILMMMTRWQGPKVSRWQQRMNRFVLTCCRKHKTIFMDLMVFMRLTALMILMDLIALIILIALLHLMNLMALIVLIFLTSLIEIIERRWQTIIFTLTSSLPS